MDDYNWADVKNTSNTTDQDMEMDEDENDQAIKENKVRPFNLGEISQDSIDQLKKWLVYVYKLTPNRVGTERGNIMKNYTLFVALMTEKLEAMKRVTVPLSVYQILHDEDVLSAELLSLAVREIDKQEFLLGELRKLFQVDYRSQLIDVVTDTITQLPDACHTLSVSRDDLNTKIAELLERH